MTAQETSVSLVKKVYSKSFSFLKACPNFFSPFILLVSFEFLALIILFLAPRSPLSIVLGPPIRTFWHEKFLHYPLNFFLLPKLVSHARMVLAILLGSLTSGMAVAIAAAIYNNKITKTTSALKVSIKKYLSLFTVLLIVNIGYFILTKLLTIGLIKYFSAGHAKLLFIGPKLWLGLIFTALLFILAGIIQALFIYSIPAIIIDNKRVFKAIGMSLGLFFKFFIPTLILVFIPLLLYIPVIVLSSKGIFLMDKFFPEIILLIEALGIIVTTLIIDPIVTMSTTVLYLIKKEEG